MDRHKHVAKEIPGDYYAEDKWRSDRAECSICGEVLYNWYCPDAPNHICRYTETEDSCDFCGMPDERK